MRSTRLSHHLAVTLLTAVPAGGFLLGLLNAGDPDPNPVGRLFYACLLAVQTPFHAGFPPDDAAGPGQSFNAWPHIAIAALLIFTGCVHRERKRSKQRTAPTA